MFISSSTFYSQQSIIQCRLSALTSPWKCCIFIHVYSEDPCRDWITWSLPLFSLPGARSGQGSPRSRCSGPKLFPTSRERESWLPRACVGIFILFGKVHGHFFLSFHFSLLSPLHLFRKCSGWLCTLHLLTLVFRTLGLRVCTTKPDSDIEGDLDWGQRLGQMTRWNWIYKWQWRDHSCCHLSWSS